MEQRSASMLLSNEHTLGAFIKTLENTTSRAAANVRTALVCVVQELQERAVGPLTLDTVLVREIDGVVFRARVASEVRRHQSRLIVVAFDL